MGQASHAHASAATTQEMSLVSINILLLQMWGKLARGIAASPSLLKQISLIKSASSLHTNSTRL
jgi:hypothetical protein